MTARLLVAALVSAGSLQLSAQTLTPTTAAMRAVQCDQQRKTFADAGVDLRGAVLVCEPGVVVPMATRQVKPKYTTAARQAKLQGSVEVVAIVDTDGSIREARILQSLDSQFGLDEEALNAARASAFEPAKLNGAPVRSAVKIVMYFTLR